MIWLFADIFEAVVVVETVQRATNGKAYYKWAKAIVLEKTTIMV